VQGHRRGKPVNRAISQVKGQGESELNRFPLCYFRGLNSWGKVLVELDTKDFGLGVSQIPFSWLGSSQARVIASSLANLQIEPKRALMF